MEIKYFPHFIRKNYPCIDLSNEELYELGNEFEIYLKEQFKDNEFNLIKIWDVKPMEVVMNSDHPLKINGYHPALILHFEKFIEVLKSKL